MKTSKKQKLVYLFRSNQGGHSVENIFKNISQNLKDSYDIQMVELPFSGLSPTSILKNIWFVSKLDGIIHVTGDIHYISILPWKKMVLTIHDVGSLLNDNSIIKRFIKKVFWIWIPLLFTRKITVVSDFTRNELLKLTSWISYKLTVIHNPILNLVFNTEINDNFNKEFPKILLIGTKPNKNVERTIESLQGIKCELWILGRLSETQIDLLEKFNISYKNHFNISNAELIELYKKCDIVSFISLYEGFGMPVIEGQAMGKVVITSNIHPIIDVAGSGAVFVNPLDSDDMKTGFLNVISNSNLRNQCIQNGLKNVERFKTEVIVEKYRKIYEEL